MVAILNLHLIQKFFSLPDLAIVTQVYVNWITATHSMQCCPWRLIWSFNWRRMCLLICLLDPSTVLIISPLWSSCTWAAVYFWAQLKVLILLGLRPTYLRTATPYEHVHLFHSSPQLLLTFPPPHVAHSVSSHLQAFPIVKLASWSLEDLFIASMRHEFSPGLLLIEHSEAAVTNAK